VRSLLIAIATLLAAPATALAATAAAGGGASVPYRPFAPDSVWNLPLRPDVPLDPNSARYVGWLNHDIAANGAWINTTTCGMPIFWADPGTPTVKVTLDRSAYQDPALINAWSKVPMPANAKPANCGDKNLAVLQRQPDGSVREWEFWKAVKAADGTWSAKWGGATSNVNTDRGIASSLSWYDPAAAKNAQRSSFGWNVTASSVSMLAGVITMADVASGHIDHALALSVSDPAKGRFAWPAQRSDGGATDPYALAEGSRLRIDPGVDLSTIPMTPLVRMMAEAAQKYGIVIRDRTYSTNAFVAEEPQPGQANPFKAALNGRYPDAALKAFPWDKLELLRAASCSGWAACEAPEAAVVDASATPVVGSQVTLDTTNSTLNQPRADVRWDLDGDGAFETDAGTAVRTTFVPTSSGTRTVGVQITTRSGSVVGGHRTIVVAPPSGGAVKPLG
jgi:hypothetical protein